MRHCVVLEKITALISCFDIKKNDINYLLFDLGFQKHLVIILFATVDKPGSSAYNIVASATVAAATCLRFLRYTTQKNVRKGFAGTLTFTVVYERAFCLTQTAESGFAERLTEILSRRKASQRGVYVGFY